jgi:hypothetical protein
LIIASVIVWTSVVVKVWRPNPTEAHDDHRCGQVARRSQTLTVASAGY